MKPEPIFAAVEAVLGVPPACPLVLLTPQGRLFTQDVARELAAPALAAQALALQGEGRARLGLLCGRYEGVDERVRQHLATDEISIGDYVLSGGELPALVVIDAVTRLLPGALGDPDGAEDDSHASGLLEYPHYTRPPEFRGEGVPDVLLSGDHARMRAGGASRRCCAPGSAAPTCWRRRRSASRTASSYGGWRRGRLGRPTFRYSFREKRLY